MLVLWVLGKLGPGQFGPGQLGPGAQLSGAQLSAQKSGKLGLGRLGPGAWLSRAQLSALESGKLGPGRLGPGAQLSGAQLSTIRKWQIGPQGPDARGPTVRSEKVANRALDSWAPEMYLPKNQKIIKKAKHTIQNANRGVPKYQICCPIFQIIIPNCILAIQNTKNII